MTASDIKDSQRKEIYSSQPLKEDSHFLDSEGVDDVYALKCILVNECLQNEIGFGGYQYQLFVLAAIGWLADNMWMQAVAVVLPQVGQELLPSHVEYTTLALYIGLILGGTIWGVLADIIGRRPSFMITLFLAAAFGVASGAAPNFVAFAALVICIGFAIGGNNAVDGALYLECTPQSHQWTLTLLSVSWSFGQLAASATAWGFIGNFSCGDSTPVGQCTKANNMGWRYTMYTLGSLTFIMFILRFIAFDLQESPKYLIARNRDEEAIRVLQHIAKRNGKSISLTVDQLSRINTKSPNSHVPKTTWEIVKSTFTTFSLSHVRPLFAGKRLATNSIITILSWGLIGLAYPLFSYFLPFYLNSRIASNSNKNIAYRNNAIISVFGIPGSLIATLLVDWKRRSKHSHPEDPSESTSQQSGAEKRSDVAVHANTANWAMGSGKWNGIFDGLWVFGGRKLVLAVSTLLSGVFLFLFTTSKSAKDVLAYSCVLASVQNAVYGVLFSYTPEVFPAPHRGTAIALATCFNRILGMLAPVIKVVTTSNSGGAGSNSLTNGSLFLSASLYIFTAFLILFLPIETAGKAAM